MKDRIAVLYRTNAQSRLFEEALRRLRIEYNIVGGFSFYERAEVKDIIAYLKLAMNPFDDIALLRVINTPPRGLGKTSLDELQRQAKTNGSSLWMTIATITDPQFPQPVNLTPRAKEAMRAFKLTIENPDQKDRDEFANRQGSFRGRHRRDRGHGLREYAAGPKTRTRRNLGSKTSRNL